MNLRKFSDFICLLRQFFNQENYIEIFSPPVVEHPGASTHIHPYEIKGLGPHNNPWREKQYLHTSPEFHLKTLLAENRDLQKIFSLGYCFRNEPSSPEHRFQFLMLEWYQRGANFWDLMSETEALVSFLSLQLGTKLPQPAERLSIHEIFEMYCPISIFDLSALELQKQILKRCPEIPLPAATLDWDDLFSLLFLNCVVPNLKNHPFVFLYHYPASQAALSLINPEDSRFCLRFELYLFGTEICNCYSELTDYQKNIQRFQSDEKQRQGQYGYQLRMPKQFLSALESGLPSCSGNALGVERLYMKLSGDSPF